MPGGGLKSGRSDSSNPTDQTAVGAAAGQTKQQTDDESLDHLSGRTTSSNNDATSLGLQSDLIWSKNNKADNCKAPNTLDSQQQRLNLLVDLISSQEAKLNRLKALRKIAKEQTAINVELNNELKTVNNSISEKDGELRQALNRVDNLTRQLNNFRRTRAHRKSTTPIKQEGNTADGTHTNFSDNNIDTTQNLSAVSGASSVPAPTTLNASSAGTNSNLIDGAIPIGESSLIPDLQDLTKTKLVNSLDRDESKSNSINSLAIVDSNKQVAHNHASPALTKYTNARQKLIGSGFKDKSNGRRVSFDPLALLLDAALEGELDLVIQTSKQVPDLSASHDECVTALHNAVVAGHYEVAKFLIEAGCDINTQDSDGWTPLHCAASCNNLPLVKLLVENGALIYATTTSDHSTPAMKCEQSEEGFEECYKYLMYLQNNLGVMNNGLVYALYDYEAQESDELTFKTDDELLILRRDDSQEQEWWWAQKRIKESSDSVVDIKEGYIPRNLVGLYSRVKAFKRTPRISDTSNKNGNGSPE